MAHRLLISRAELATALLAGTALAALGMWLTSDALARAMWAVFSIVFLLPLAAGGLLADGPSHPGSAPTSRLDLYFLGTAPVLLATLFAGGILSTAVVLSLIASLAGLLALFVRVGIRSTFAVGVILVQSALFLTWPVWASHLLLKFDSQPLVDLLVRVGPLFALNAAIDPTDPFTHRPLAYTLMNLGQDIPYAMPSTIWPCVILHVAAGLPGLWLAWLGRRSRMRPGDEAPTAKQIDPSV
jgi:hypothetical protein